jgi:hypothetical protein
VSSRWPQVVVVIHVYLMRGWARWKRPAYRRPILPRLYAGAIGAGGRQYNRLPQGETMRCSHSSGSLVRPWVTSDIARAPGSAGPSQALGKIKIDLAMGRARLFPGRKVYVAANCNHPPPAVMATGRR